MRNTLFVMFLICFSAGASAEKIPTGYNSWRQSGSAEKHIIEFGAAPVNYWDGSGWTEIDPRFHPGPRGFRSIKSRHFVDIDTVADIVRFAITDYAGNVQVMRTRIGPLFLYDRSTGDSICLASPNLAGYVGSNDTVKIPDVYPGVHCLIINRSDGLEHRFVFTPAADIAIHRAWKEAGSSSTMYSVNSFRLLGDSLDLQLRDLEGSLEFGQNRDIAGDIDLVTRSGYHLFSMPQGNVFRDTLSAPLYRRVIRSETGTWFYEGYRIADIESWPRIGFEHSESRTWSTSTIDTYISAASPGSSFYTSANLAPYRDVTLGVRQRVLVWFQGLIDSLSTATTIDSALLQMHYYGGVIGSGTARLCRGITDSAWYNSTHATWNARYKLFSDSVKWLGGWGIHTSSFTAANSVTLNLADTNSSGWYQFSCKDLIGDIKSDGTDWGFWIDNGSGSNSQRTIFDSAEDPGHDYPRLYIEYSRSGGNIRRRRMEDR